MYELKQQKTLLYKGYDVLLGLSEYKNRLKYVPLFVSVVLAYTISPYTGNLNNINSNLHNFSKDTLFIKKNLNIICKH